LFQLPYLIRCKHRYIRFAGIEPLNMHT